MRPTRTGHVEVGALSVKIMKPSWRSSPGGKERPKISIAPPRSPHPNLGGFKQPTSVDLIDEIQRSFGGKVLKKDLRAAYWDNRDRAVN